MVQDDLQQRVSIRAPRAGRKNRLCRLKTNNRRFNPRPASGAKGSAVLCFCDQLLQSFNPRPASGAKVQTPGKNEQSRRVSIRAPRAGRKASIGCQPPPQTGFNPRPASGAKGLLRLNPELDQQVSIRAPRAGRKCVHRLPAASADWFQSAPRERGESGGGHAIALLGLSVSIRAPRAGRKRE